MLITEPSSDPNWWQVRTPDSVFGYLNVNYLSPQRQVEQTLTGVVSQSTGTGETLRKAGNVPFSIGRCGVQVASRSILSEARQVVAELGIQSTAEIYRAPNGWFVIVAGTISETANFARVVAKHQLPDDSICVKATTFSKLDEALRKARNVPFPADRCGVQVASRPGLDEARQVIDELGIKSTAEIYRAPNGWFVIVAGIISETANFERVIAKYRLPIDSICVKATTFRRLG